VSPVKYELGSYIPEDDILHSHRRENLGSYKTKNVMHAIDVCRCVGVVVFAAGLTTVVILLPNLFNTPPPLLPTRFVLLVHFPTLHLPLEWTSEHCLGTWYHILIWPSERDVMTAVGTNGTLARARTDCNRQEVRQMTW
jgi:hypothetical protein